MNQCLAKELGLYPVDLCFLKCVCVYYPHQLRTTELDSLAENLKAEKSALQKTQVLFMYTKVLEQLP